MKSYRYPCTGNISIRGFGEFLENEIREPRRNIRLFTDELNGLLGSKYLTLTNSGSSANLVAALVLAEKCRATGKPLTSIASAFTFPTTISSLRLAGFKVTLVDVEKDGFNIDVEKLKAVKPVASVFAVTHFLGFACDVKSVCQYAREHGSFVLQDACETFNLQNLREDIDYRYCRLGDITTLSFYHPHHLSSYGGGAVICNDISDYVLCDSIAHWGRACKCHIDESLCHNPDGPAHQFTYERIGVNVEISELNACFGRWQLRNWSAIEGQRIANYLKLYHRLAGNPNLHVWQHDVYDDSKFVFPIRLKNGMNVRQAWELLSPKGVEIRTLMGGATCTQPAFGELPTADNQENAKEMADTTFFVGIHHTLPEDDVITVANIINETFI